MRLCNSRLPEEHFGYYQTSQRNWVIIKEYYRCLQWSMLGWRISRLGFVTPIVGEVSLGPLGNTHHISLASITTNMLVVRWCITERVKRLAGNEIELGIGYRRSNLGQVTYRWQREQRMLLCGLTDKDLRRICGNQYEHPGSAIGYWPERCLGHVYIVLEPVGSARLTLRWQFYWVLMYRRSSESRMRSGTWRGVSKWSRRKYRYIGRLYSDFRKVPSDSGIFRSTGELRNSPGSI